jgi:hypothetical protein
MRANLSSCSTCSSSLLVPSNCVPRSPVVIAAATRSEAAVVAVGLSARLRAAATSSRIGHVLEVMTP